MCGMLVDRKKSDLFGGITSPAPRDWFSWWILLTGLESTRPDKNYTVSSMIGKWNKRYFWYLPISRIYLMPCIPRKSPRSSSLIASRAEHGVWWPRLLRRERVLLKDWAGLVQISQKKASEQLCQCDLCLCACLFPFCFFAADFLVFFRQSTEFHHCYITLTALLHRLLAVWTILLT